MVKKRNLPVAQQVAERDGPWAPVGRGVGDLHDRLLLDEVESDRVGQDLGDACGVHVSSSGGRVLPVGCERRCMQVRTC